MKNPTLLSIQYYIIILIALCCSSLEAISQVDTSQVLIGADNQKNYYEIDITTGNATLIGSIDGNCSSPKGVVSIAYDNISGRAFGQSPAACFEFFEFNPANGSLIASHTSTVVPAGMEFVNGVLYGSDITSGNLVIMNLNTGIVTPVGPHGISSAGSISGVGWLNGLAYDNSNQIMYGISGGLAQSGSPDILYTVNLTTGAATSIGTTGITFGSLSFGPDGKLYGGGGGANKGNLYEINTATGVPTLIGPTLLSGTPTITSLMLRSTPCVQKPKCNERTVTVYLNSDGLHAIVLDSVDNGTATCGILELSTNPDTVDCSLLGPVSVKLLARDINNPSIRDSCFANFLVKDTTEPNAQCKTEEIIVYLDTSGSAYLSVNMVDSGSSDNCYITSKYLSDTTFDCSDMPSVVVTLTVEDSDTGLANTSSCSALITVADTIDPNALCSNATVYLTSSGNISLAGASFDGGSSDNCQALNYSLITSLPSNCPKLGDTELTLVVLDNAGNSDSCQATVTILDTVQPSIVCNDGLGDITVNVGPTACTAVVNYNIASNDNCEHSLTLSSGLQSGSSFSVGDTVDTYITYVAEDSSGNKDSCSFSITVVNNQIPSALCKDDTLYLDTIGEATLSVGDIDNGSNDNCGIKSISLNRTLYSCSDLFAIDTVELTIVNVAGNRDSCTAMVTVLDTLDPTTACKPATLYLNSSGSAILDPEQINDGSSSFCAAVSLSASQTLFDCLDLGINAITLTVTDISNNSQTCLANVTVVDTMDPIANCKNISVLPDPSGSLTISAEDVNDNSSDNCQIDTIYLSQYIFDCTVLDVTLIVKDSSGNADSCIALITYIDSIKPEALCKNISAELDSFGSVTINPDSLDNGSSDNCAVTGVSLNETTFNCSDLTTNTVVLSVTDAAGNIDTCHASVLVSDDLSPVAICQNASVILDYYGNATLDLNLVNNGSYDNCGPLSFVLSDSTFDCSDEGSVNVTLFVSDGSSNTSTCSSTISIIDNVVSFVNCVNKEIFLDNSGTAYLFPDDVDSASYDNCGIADRSLSIDTFDCSQLHSNVVTLLVTDINGNSGFCTSVVKVSDTIKPIASCKDTFTVYLTSSSYVKLPGHVFNDGSSDNCGPLWFSADKSFFDCSNLGFNTVTLTVSDDEGNVAPPCLSIVNIQEVNKPTALCKNNITLYLDANGDAQLSSADLDNGSFDDCSSLTFTLDKNTMHCASNVVTMTVTDMCGNAASCSGTVYTIDTIPPTVQCINQVLNLDAVGQGSITVGDVNGGISDECGLGSIQLSQSNFTCNDLGNQSEQLIVNDNSGNQTICNFIVSVLDPTNACAPACPPPGNPLTSGIGLTQANLEWDEVFGATSYTITGRESGKGWVTINTPNTIIAISGLKSSTTYEWNVLANCTNNLTSTKSQTVSFTTLSCNKPSNIHTNNIGTTSAILNWNVVPEAIGYKLLGKEVGNHSPVPIQLTNGNINSMFASGLRPGKTYVWSIQTVCKASNPLIASDWSAVNTFSTNSVSSTSKTAEIVGSDDSWDVKIYPNPTNGLFQIDLEGVSEEIHVNVYDILQRHVYSGKVNLDGLLSNVLIDIRGEEAGVYFVEIVNGEMTEVVRVVKH